jgi:hypothetical protein
MFVLILLVFVAQGISGQNQEVAGPMERISAMIPPPPHPAAANVSSSDEVEDWK